MYLLPCYKHQPRIQTLKCPTHPRCIKTWGYRWSRETTFGWITIPFCADISGTLRMDPADSSASVVELLCVWFLQGSNQVNCYVPVPRWLLTEALCFCIVCSIVVNTTSQEHLDKVQIQKVKATVTSNPCCYNEFDILYFLWHECPLGSSVQMCTVNSFKVISFIILPCEVISFLLYKLWQTHY